MIVQGAFGRANLLQVQWQLGNFCNYRCSYCSPDYNSGSTPAPSLEVAKAVVDNILKKASTRNVRFNFLGGEPTVFRGFDELLKHIYDEGGTSMYVSNGSRTPTFFKKIAPYTHSAYFTFHSDEAKISKFLEVLKIFSPKKIFVYVPMNIPKWDVCFDAYNQIYDAGFRVIPKVLYDDYGGGRTNKSLAYTPEQQSFINGGNLKMLARVPQNPIDREFMLPLPYDYKSPVNDEVDLRFGGRVIRIFNDGAVVKKTSGQNLIVEKQNDYFGYRCYGGIELLNISRDGSVFTTVCAQDSPVGNIFNNPEFDLPSEPMTCKLHQCWCEADLMITKMSPDETSQLKCNYVGKP